MFVPINVVHSFVWQKADSFAHFMLQLIFMNDNVFAEIMGKRTIKRNVYKKTP